MRRNSLLRSTPFRLALAFSALLMAGFVFSAIVAFDLISNELNARYDSRLKEMFGVISQTYVDSDIQDLVDATNVHIAATSRRQNVFLLQASDGHVLAGNIPTIKVPDGRSNLPGTRFGIDTDYGYRLYAGKVGDNRLIVGTSDEETGDLQEIVLASLGWASLVVLILAIAGGSFLAFRAQRRLDAVRDTMGRVSLGALDARIPLLGGGDDIDLLSRDINEALARLALTVDGMRQVSTDIAHDLKTPLNRLKMTLETAHGRQQEGLAVTEELEAASNEADQINQTFEALLRIAQIESGSRKAHFSRVDLVELLASLAEVYTEVAADMGRTLATDLPVDTKIMIHGDRELLTQMFVNLIENAVRHCPAGSTIRMGVAGRDGVAVATVEDNGPGIPSSEYERVFRRLYRLEKSRTSPGTGLGLSLVKAIVDLHDGRIRLEDAGPGLRAVVSFGLGI